LGAGKRLFADGTIPLAIKLTESPVTPNGVIIVNYERADVLAASNVQQNYSEPRVFHECLLMPSETL
jgi:hypothetical protein